MSLKLIHAVLLLAAVLECSSQYADFIQGLNNFFQPFQVSRQNTKLNNDRGTTRRPDVKRANRPTNKYDLSSIIVFPDDIYTTSKPTRKNSRINTSRQNSKKQDGNINHGRSHHQGNNRHDKNHQQDNNNNQQDRNNNHASNNNKQQQRYDDQQINNNQQDRYNNQHGSNSQQYNNGRQQITSNTKGNSRQQNQSNQQFGNTQQSSIIRQQQRNEQLTDHRYTNNKNESSNKIVVKDFKSTTPNYNNGVNLNYDSGRNIEEQQNMRAPTNPRNVNVQNLNKPIFPTNAKLIDSSTNNNSQKTTNFNQQTTNLKQQNRPQSNTFTTNNPLYRPGAKPAPVDESRPPITNRPATQSPFGNLPRPIDQGFVYPEDPEPDEEVGPDEDDMSPAVKRRYAEIAERMCDSYKALNVKKVAALPLVPSAEPVEVDVSNCSPFNVALIIGGSISNIRDFPHMAVVGWTKVDRKGYIWKCGGSLISDKYVLTAGHCTYNDKDYNVISGSPKAVQLGSSYLDDPGSTVVRISSVIKHPKYKQRRSYHDVALLKLANKVVFSDTIKPACLGVPPPVGQPIIATGWGRTEYGGDQSLELRSVSLRIWDMADCKEIWGTSLKLPNGPSTDNQVCAGDRNGGKDTCQGDSGGPAQVQDGCVWRVVAVTSIGRSCGAPDTPALYATIPTPFVAAEVFGDQFDQPSNNRQQNPNFNNMQSNFNNRQPNFNTPQSNSDNRQSNFNNPQSHGNNQQPNFNKPQSNFNNQQSNLNNPLSNLNNPQSNLNNPQSNFNNPQSNFNNPQSNLNNPQSNFNNPQPNFNNQPNLDISFPDATNTFITPNTNSYSKDYFNQQNDFFKRNNFETTEVPWWNR